MIDVSNRFSLSQLFGNKHEILAPQAPSSMFFVVKLILDEREFSRIFHCTNEVIAHCTVASCQAESNLVIQCDALNCPAYHF